MDVHVEADARGGGEVRARAVLDRALVERLGDLREAIRLDDLRAGGWTVVGPLRTPSGGASVEARKRFADEDGLRRVLVELVGDGAVDDVSFDHDRSFVRTRTALELTLDLRRGLETFSDDRLRETLGGLPLGVPAPELERAVGGPLTEAVSIELRAALPGGDRVVMRPELGRQATLRAAGERVHVTAVVAGLAALVAAAGAVLTGVRAARRPEERDEREVDRPEPPPG